MPELLDAADHYIDLGLAVIALTGKTPNVKVHRHGLKDALSKEYAGLKDRLAAFTHPATTGIGILTSYPYFVVDIDGEEGAENWRALVAEDDFIPERWVAKTGRGLHMWFAHEEQTGSMSLGRLLDLKGHGGYVAAPPSQHFDADGKPDYVYSWLLDPSDGPPMSAPEALVRRIRAHNRDAQRSLVGKSHAKRIRHRPLEGGKLWADWGFEPLITGMAEAGDGNRNNYLHWAASAMAEEGAHDEEFDALREAALGNGLTSLEVRRTIRSARARSG